MSDQINFQFGQGARPADGSFEPLPVGDYRVIVAKIETGMSVNHDPQWKIQLQVLEGPHSGRFLFERVTFSQASENFVMAFFIAMGMNVQAGQSVQCGIQDIQGRACVAKVTGHRSYTDKNGNQKQAEEVVLVPDTGPQNAGQMAPRAQPQPQMQQQQGFGQQGTIPVEPPVQQQQPLPQQQPAPQQNQGGLPNPPF